MTNMSYCRFENTHSDLDDCFEHMEDGDLSASEAEAKDRLIALCKTIAEENES